jgi:ABC-type dipeptide/oligopeptide/nickel transport system permease subunit
MSDKTKTEAVEDRLKRLEEEVEERGASQWQIVWRRFRKNKTALIGAGILFAILILALSAPVLTFIGILPDPNDTRFLLDPPELGGGSRTPPTIFHLFGTDKWGRDILSRIMWGAQVALIVGVVAQSISTLIAVVIGGIAGYFGGRVDTVLMRLADIFLVMPVFLIMLLAVRILSLIIVAGYGIWIIIIVLGIFGWASTARMVRAQFLQIKTLDYVEAARELGVSKWSIIFKHILPNALGPIIVVSTIGIAGNILSEAGLSFLGFGDPNTVSWGQMVSMAQDAVFEAPWLSLFPGFAIFFAVLSFNLLGDGLADALDPRLWR